MLQTGDAAKLIPDCRIMVGAKLTEIVKGVLSASQGK
jgi:hypothetical protein